MSNAMQVDESKLNAFIGQMLSDLGGASSVAMVRMGDALGLYKTLNANGPMTAVELARKANVDERYVREWLSHQAASNYLSYEPASGKFSLLPEQAAHYRYVVWVIVDDQDLGFAIHLTLPSLVSARQPGNLEPVFAEDLQGVDKVLEHHRLLDIAVGPLLVGALHVFQTRRCAEHDDRQSRQSLVAAHPAQYL